jgi:hypothetical protein
MNDELAGATGAQARLNLLVRPDQKAAIERLARSSDLTITQVARRLLDLGLAAWAERGAAPLSRGVVL